jgi:hypothetical protein
VLPWYNDFSMKKELLVAVVIGLLVGLVITYGVYRASTAGRGPRSTTQTTITTDSTAHETSTLVLSSPEDESVQTTDQITVAGTTLPDSTVVVFVNDLEHITTADRSGNFSVVGKLEAGSNVIIVHSLTEDGSLTMVERTVIYITDSLTAVSASASASPSPTARATARPTAKPTTSP